MKSILSLPVTLLLILTAVSHANTLEKRHQVGLRLGMWGQVAEVRTEIGAGSTSTSVGSNGVLGGAAYGYSVTEGFAVSASIGLMAADVTTKTGLTGVSSETATVTQVMLGTKMYLPRSTYGTSVRPFLSVGAGPCFGSQTSTKVGTTVVVESRSATAMSAQLGGGIDFFLSRRFLAGVSVGYNLMSDFVEPIGGSKNYSGPEFVVGLNILFGRQ